MFWNNDKQHGIKTSAVLTVYAISFGIMINNMVLKQSCEEFDSEAI